MPISRVLYIVLAHFNNFLWSSQVIHLYLELAAGLRSSVSDNSHIRSCWTHRKLILLCFFCMCVCWLLSHVRLFATLWTIACQARLSEDFSRQEYWSELPFPSLEDLPNQGSNPDLLLCRKILYHLGYQRSPCFCIKDSNWNSVPILNQNTYPQTLSGIKLVTAETESGFSLSPEVNTLQRVNRMWFLKNDPVYQGKIHDNSYQLGI